jgi:hypothetical protein
MIGEANFLPFEEDISTFLAPGINFIDVYSENGGSSGCEVSVALVRYGGNQNPARNTIHIENGEGKTPALIANLSNEEFFYAGGPASPAKSDGAPLTIAPYGTPRREHLHRLCGRIRIRLDVSKAQYERLQTRASFERWAQQRRKKTVCSYQNDNLSGCRVRKFEKV